MKIISKFKDYYDFIQYQYGIDEKYVYDRKLLPTSQGYLEGYYSIVTNNISNVSSDENILALDKKDEELIIRSYSSRLGSLNLQYYWLFICGKRFLIEFDGSSWKVSERDSKVILEFYFPYSWSNKTNKYDKLNQGEFNDKFLQFSIKYKCPIIVIYKGKIVYTKSPILSEILGFVKLYSPEQIYQDIYYFISNQVNGSPDIDPPVVLDNKWKVVYHGFTKQSFKHKKVK